MNETRNEKKHNGYFLYILFSLCFLFAIFSTCLYFYRFVDTYEFEPVTDVSDESSEELPKKTVTKVIKVVYPTGSEVKPIKTTDVVPGQMSIIKEIKITNKSDADLKYNLKWTNVTNDFVNYQDLVYYIDINDRRIAEGSFPKTDSVILADVSLAKGDEHNINVYVEYKNRDYDQSVDMNKTFAGVLIVDNVE